MPFFVNGLVQRVKEEQFTQPKWFNKPLRNTFLSHGYLYQPKSIDILLISPRKYMLLVHINASVNIRPELFFLSLGLQEIS